MNKICKRCETPKPLEEFYEINNKKKAKDGTVTKYKTRHSYCKPCLKEYRDERYGNSNYDKDYHIKNQDRILAYQKVYYDENTAEVNERCRKKYAENKEQYHKAHREWKKRNPDAFKAYAAIARAKANGKLVPPKGCECCGREVRLEAHHHDGYEGLDMLKVLFICRKCHRGYHKGINDKLKNQLDKLHKEKYGNN